MDAVRNPFAPGAGLKPPELVGRETVIEDALVSIRRCLLGRSSRSWMMLGLRGTGKTVLLNHIAQLAEAEGALTLMIEAPETGEFPRQLVPLLNRLLRRLSVSEKARAFAHKAMRILRSFAGSFKVEIAEIGISVDPEPGTGDSGLLDLDLTDLLMAVGEAAKADGTALVLLIDEVQYLNKEELGALITALHRANQRALPVLFFGAGLPQVAGLAGEAKSYAERLFRYETIGALEAEDAGAAIREPIAREGESITAEAVTRIVGDTEGYPYFLQEWGYQVWNGADASPIPLDVVERAAEAALDRLDKGFFKVRIDRLTPKEREYVNAMAELPGDGPYRSGDVADKLGEPATRMGPRRQGIIRKGMIYSPAHGDIAFTVPGFKDYLMRVSDEG